MTPKPLGVRIRAEADRVLIIDWHSMTGVCTLYPNSIESPRRQPRKRRLSIQIFVSLSVAMLVGLALFIGCGKQTVESPLDKAKQLLFQKNYDQALASCDNLLAQDSTYYEARVLRGEINEKSARQQEDAENVEKLRSEAIADFTKAIESHPTKPDAYYWRYNIYKSLVETAEDEDAKEQFTTLWAEDYKNYKKFEPSSALTYANSVPRAKPKSLQTPMPLTPEDLIPDRVAETEKKTDAEAEPEERDPFDTSEPRDDEPSDDVATNDAPSNEDTEQELIKRDLASNQSEDDFTLPHADPKRKQESLEPPPQIVRNDLGAFQPLQFPVNPRTKPNDDRSYGGSPYGKDPASTGFTQQPPTEEPPAWNQPDYRSSPFLQPTGNFGQATANRSTGFNGTQRQPTNRPNLTGIGGFQSPAGTTQSRFINGPTGFLPPEAQGKFGPRINPGAAQSGGATGNASSETGEETPRLPLYGNTPRPMLTTALPGTVTLQGQRDQRTKLNQFGPNYTPIGQRPAATYALPTLPPQQ